MANEKVYRWIKEFNMGDNRGKKKEVNRTSHEKIILNLSRMHIAYVLLRIERTHYQSE